MIAPRNESANLLDPTGLHILRLLAENARLSHAELGRQVSLSAPAVAERIRRMEEAGIIAGYHAAINLEALGYPISVFIQVTAGHRQSCDSISAWALIQPGVIACYHLTGEKDVMIHAAFATVRDLERMSEQLCEFGNATTSLILSRKTSDQPLPPLLNRVGQP